MVKGIKRTELPPWFRVIDGGKPSAGPLETDAVGRDPKTAAQALLQVIRGAVLAAHDGTSGSARPIQRPRVVASLEEGPTDVKAGAATVAMVRALVAMARFNGGASSVSLKRYFLNLPTIRAQGIDDTATIAQWLNRDQTQRKIEQAIVGLERRVNKRLLDAADEMLDVADGLFERGDIKGALFEIEGARAKLDEATEQIDNVKKVAAYYERAIAAIQKIANASGAEIDESYFERAKEMLYFIKIKLFELSSYRDDVMARFDFCASPFFRENGAVEENRSWINFIRHLSLRSAKRLFFEHIPMAAVEISEVLSGRRTLGAGQNSLSRIRDIDRDIHDAAQDLSDNMEAVATLKSEIDPQVADEFGELFSFVELQSAKAAVIVKRISDVIRRVLAPNGHGHATADIFDVSCVKGIVNFVRYLNELEADERKVEIELAGEIPDGVVVPPDLRYDLIMILNSAMDNAVKYGRSKVEVRVGHEDDVLEIEVSDDGAGLSEGDIERILENPGLRLRSDIAPGYGADISLMTNGICGAHDWSFSYGLGNGLGGLHAAFAISTTSWAGLSY